MNNHEIAMDYHEGLVSFMDLLDLDEEVIDSRLQALMLRNTYTNEHLVSAIRLLQYKQLVNTQEKTDCENDAEFEFVAKLIKHVNSENIDNICKIIYIVLCLNFKTLGSNSEHLIQQVLSNIYLSKDNPNLMSSVEDESVKQILYSLKLCDSVLNAVSKSGEKISLLFLDVPLENVLFSSSDLVKAHFLINTVPKLFENVIGYNILDRIWASIKQSCTENDKERALKTLSCLSDFYVPVPDSNGLLKFESGVIFEKEFWNLILFGLELDDAGVRKYSIYLLKRAIDCVEAMKKDIVISSELETLFLWKTSDEKSLRQSWENYFTLIDSLEEKQSNIVLPSLKLFHEVKDICKCWLHSTFKRGLEHDNTQVKLKCIEYRFNIPLRNVDEAEILLEALNDINLYENITDINKTDLDDFLNNEKNFSFIFEVIPKIKWSPVPFYHLSEMLSKLEFTNLHEIIGYEKICNIVNDILRVPCNSVEIRNVVHQNIGQFVDNSTELHWRDLMNIYSVLKKSISNNQSYLLHESIRKLKIVPEEKEEFLNTISTSYQSEDLILVYLENKNDMVEPYLDVINKKFMKINNIVSRQYCDRSEGFDDLIYLVQLINNVERYTENYPMYIPKIKLEVLLKNYKTVLQYIQCLLSSDIVVSVEDVKILFNLLDSIKCVKKNDEFKEVTLNLYTNSLLVLLSENSDIVKKVLSVSIVKYILSNDDYFKKLETLDEGFLKKCLFLNITNNVELKDISAGSNGRTKNLFCETLCELNYCLVNSKDSESTRYIQNVVNYIDTTIESGGYGCLKWVVKIVNVVLPKILENEDVTFYIPQFLDRIWKEIEELKSNNQYLPCIQEFVILITQRCLLEKPMYNNIITFYCNKIIENGPQKSNALYYLVQRLCDLKPECGLLVYVLCEVLLYAPLLRKDQRILENLVVKLTPLCSEFSNWSYFNYEIQYTAACALSKIEHKEMYKTITLFITKRIDELFKNKRRYYDNSQVHRTLLRGLQHLVMICLLHPQCLVEDRLVEWCVELLGKLPHQPSVRTCLEWVIALHFEVKGLDLSTAHERLKSKNVPITSQFTVLYWIIRHKIVCKKCTQRQYHFVMNFFLSHTMGQTFNTRLYAQYLASKLHKESSRDLKYSYIVEVIDKTLAENDKDKNYLKLKKDIFYNRFDIVAFLAPEFVYLFLPRYFGLGANESLDTVTLMGLLMSIRNELDERDLDNDFKKRWMAMAIWDEHIIQEVNEMGMEGEEDFDGDEDTFEIIQKKYVPWKNMTDIEVYEMGRKKENSSELIVVASLIDKLPNLGGVVRTSEVFGVESCVVGNSASQRRAEFQATSVSAERWVNMEEVRPGAPLKSYLMRMKAEGFSVVAAEQTSNSCQLHKFKFPKKTVLVLGHEKEGIPCDLLPLMDHYVEIPQQGVIRSLNVHVTAAIFVWQYTVQHVL